MTADVASPDCLDFRRVLSINDSRAIHEEFHTIPTSVQESGLEEDDAELFGVNTDLVPQAPFKLDSAYQGNEALALV